MEKPSANSNQPTVAHHQISEIHEPCECTFYFSPLPVQLKIFLKRKVVIWRNMV